MNYSKMPFTRYFMTALTKITFNELGSYDQIYLTEGTEKFVLNIDSNR